jgi:hypothetical protein
MVSGQASLEAADAVNNADGIAVAEEFAHSGLLPIDQPS